MLEHGWVTSQAKSLAPIVLFSVQARPVAYKFQENITGGLGGSSQTMRPRASGMCKSVKLPRAARKWPSAACHSVLSKNVRLTQTNEDDTQGVRLPKTIKIAQLLHEAVARSSQWYRFRMTLAESTHAKNNASRNANNNYSISSQYDARRDLQS